MCRDDIHWSVADSGIRTVSVDKPHPHFCEYHHDTSIDHFSRDLQVIKECGWGSDVVVGRQAERRVKFKCVCWSGYQKFGTRVYPVYIILLMEQRTGFPSSKLLVTRSIDTFEFHTPFRLSSYHIFHSSAIRKSFLPLSSVEYIIYKNYYWNMQWYMSENKK